MDAVLGVVKEVTEGATQYVRIVSDRPVRLEHRHARPESISVRAILPRSFDQDVQTLLRQNWPGSPAEVAYLEPVPATLVLNETRAAVLFPGLDGQIDMNRGLAGESHSFQGWCRDLFDALWGRARKALM